MICHCCGQPISNRYIAIERRIERLKITHRHVTCHVLESLAFPLWCSKACWQGDAATFIASLHINHTYPHTNSQSPCGFCGKAVDRMSPHISYAIVETEEEVKPWLTTGIVHSDETLAVLCSDCEPPDFSDEAAHRLGFRVELLLASTR